MISRRFFTSGILVLGLSSQSQAAFFGIKTKAEKEADARVETEELNSLKKSLKLAKKKGKKLSSEDLYQACPSWHDDARARRRCSTHG